MPLPGRSPARRERQNKGNFTMRALMSYGLALVIAVVAGAWLATGSLVQGGNGPGNGEKSIIALLEGSENGPIGTTLKENGLLAEPPHHGDVDPHLTIAQRTAETTGNQVANVSVRYIASNVQPLKVEVPLRGRTKAKASVGAVAETAGIVADVLVSKGQRVANGDVLCRLDRGTREAAVRQAEAALAQAEAGLAQSQADFDTNKELREKGLAAANSARQLEVALRAAQSAVSAGQSALDNANAELERTEIKAKVAGIVQDPMTSAGTMLAIGQPCATVVELDPMLFVGMVPEVNIELARLDLPATVTTVTGTKAEGKVTYISSTADDATRAFAIEIELPNADGRLRDGVTAEASVDVGTAPAHLLPQSTLTLDENGVLGVRTVTDGVVGFSAITIVRDTREGVWVTGLPAQANVITIGQESVQVGQRVNASQAAEAAGETK